MVSESSGLMMREIWVNLESDNRKLELTHLKLVVWEHRQILWDLNTIKPLIIMISTLLITRQENDPIILQ